MATSIVESKNRETFAAPAGVETVADLVHQLGDIPLARIRMNPPPGTATVDDLIALADAPNKVLCELIDGTLVEKDMSALGSFLAGLILHFIHDYLEETNRGIAFGADGPFRILPHQVRLPDVSVILWKSLPGEKFPEAKVPTLAPDLAVEVISESNTKKEIERKLKEYFQAGVKQAWVIYPKTQSAYIYSSATKRKKIGPDQSLTGGKVLPKFELPMVKLFARLTKPKKTK